jgi:glyoxylase-like metal-dependent hydrolase (beta-lactamase superfamily II)
MQGNPGEAVALPTNSVTVLRLLGNNPGPMTGPGTNSYLIVGRQCCLLDPGPADAGMVAAVQQTLAGRSLDYILVTHTHRDHSPGAALLQKATGAELIGLPAPDAEGQDRSFVPARSWRDGDQLDCGDYRLQLIHTPGHVSNHLCYLLVEERLLFTGDHVLQGTTPVILPPDGDMSDYLGSLATLQTLDLAMLAPGHGEVMHEPQAELARLIAHRLKREAKIVAGLEMLGRTDIDNLVRTVYDDVASHLLPWARRTLLAHLIKLQRDGRAEQHEQSWQLRPEQHG